jgi:ankyrin repeat protein
MNKINELTLEYIKSNYVTPSQINSINEDGNSIFTVFLEGYYESLNNLSEQDKEQILQFDIEDRIIIKEVAEYFLRNNADFNLFEEINENSKPAIAIAVLNNDYFMVKFLLTNKADPNLYTKKITINDNVFYTNKLLEYINKQVESNPHSVLLREIKKILLHFGAHDEI